MEEKLKVVSLASLAVSVSAATLLGVSEVARADPPACVDTPCMIYDPFYNYPHIHPDFLIYLETGLGMHPYVQGRCKPSVMTYSCDCVTTGYAGEEFTDPEPHHECWMAEGR